MAINPITEEFVKYLLNGLPLNETAKNQLQLSLDSPSNDQSDSLQSLTKKVLTSFLSHQSNGDLDVNGFSHICTTLTGYLYGEREIQKRMPATAIISRRLSLILKASSAITDQAVRDMVTFDEDERENKPYSGVLVANKAIASDRIEKAVMNGVPMEYMAAVMDGQGELPQKRAPSGCGCCIFIGIGIMATFWMLF